MNEGRAVPLDAMGEITIERNPGASTVSWPDLLRFIHVSFAYMDQRIDPPSSLHELTAETLREKAQSETLFLARDGGRIVGCMFCREEGAFLYIGKVAVALADQGKGIGRKLFDAAGRMARADGMMGLELETRIELVENYKAFERLGFVKISESAHTGFDRPTSIRMRAVLD